MLQRGLTSYFIYKMCSLQYLSSCLKVIIILGEKKSGKIYWGVRHSQSVNDKAKDTQPGVEIWTQTQLFYPRVPLCGSLMLFSSR